MARAKTAKSPVAKKSRGTKSKTTAEQRAAQKEQRAAQKAAREAEKKARAEQRAAQKAAREAEKKARAEQREANKKSKASWLEKAEAYGEARQAYQGARSNLRKVVRGGIKERNKARKAGKEFTSPDLTEPLKARSTALSTMQKARDELESEYASTHNLQVGKRGGKSKISASGKKNYIDSKGRVH